ncbi:hypothetical protein HWB62_gp14 [Clostridium phage CPS2]|uniref:Uncharacterized protein n=1 Tax=Clostridium phage CPS2 TaxID=2175605 RepID=A0A343X845_9CAUD|nr:hypothetical protein HWB62_gp14 [Clostridium phage CPS2]AWG96521.1 hypothetical protein CPS2_14 [Clostridium phage CPS2]
MSHFDQNLKIVKKKKDELYFKIYAMYVDNRIFKNVTCVLLKGDTIIKTLKPICIEEDGIYFMLDNELPCGEYTYRVAEHEKDDMLILMNGRELVIYDTNI